MRHQKLPVAKIKMEKALWWLLFDGKVVTVDGVTLGLFCRAKNFHWAERLQWSDDGDEWVVLGRGKV